MTVDEQSNRAQFALRQLRVWEGERQDALGAVRLAAENLRTRADALVGRSDGQSEDRCAAERDLSLAKRLLTAALATLSELPETRNTENVTYVNTGAAGRLVTMPPTMYDLKRSRPGPILEEKIERIEVAVETLNDRRPEEQAAAEGRQAMATMQNALRRSADAFDPGAASRLSASTALAAAPFLAFLLAALAGLFLAPTGVAVWVVVSALLLTSIGAAVAVLRRGPTAGTLAGVGAASSLAVFSAAYLACRALDAASVVRQGDEAVPIAHIAEACFASLTVGVTGGTIGIDLGGAARVVAFVQILLTLAVVATVVAIGWRSLSARIVRPPEQPSELPRG